MPQTTASTPFRLLVYFRRMKERIPAWVGSVAALFSDVAVMAWSIVLLAMIGSVC
jgi:hypothetical protein